VYLYTVFVGCSGGTFASSVVMFRMAMVSRVRPSIPPGVTHTHVPLYRATWHAPFGTSFQPQTPYQSRGIQTA
jgi:hypothetical protein